MGFCALRKEKDDKICRLFYLGHQFRIKDRSGSVEFSSSFIISKTIYMIYRYKIKKINHKSSVVIGMTVSLVKQSITEVLN